jgi:flavorubredoxin
MKALVVYDSNYGNTRMLAETIARELGKGAKAVHVDEANPGELQGLDLLVVGSPIIAWNPTQKIKKFLGKIKSANLDNMKAAAFDTRIDIKIHGDACEKIGKKLQAAGLELAADPRYFFVVDKEGPLADGELESAVKWAAILKKNV